MRAELREAAGHGGRGEGAEGDGAAGEGRSGAGGRGDGDAKKLRGGKRAGEASRRFVATGTRGGGVGAVSEDARRRDAAAVLVGGRVSSLRARGGWVAAVDAPPVHGSERRSDGGGDTEERRDETALQQLRSRAERERGGRRVSGEGGREE